MPSELSRLFAAADDASFELHPLDAAMVKMAKLLAKTPRVREHWRTLASSPTASRTVAHAVGVALEFVRSRPSV